MGKSDECFVFRVKYEDLVQESIRKLNAVIHERGWTDAVYYNHPMGFIVFKDSQSAVVRGYPTHK